jgi:hypothetical protein
MHITVELTANEKLLSILEKIADNLTPAKTIAPSNGKVKAIAGSTPQKQDPPADIKQDTEVQTQTGIKTEAVSIEQVRAAVVKKSQGGRKGEIVNLLSEFGVANVTGLSKDQYSEFLNKVEAL